LESSKNAKDEFFSAVQILYLEKSNRKTADFQLSKAATPCRNEIKPTQSRGVGEPPR
jgi:hypothetical protein